MHNLFSFPKRGVYMEDSILTSIKLDLGITEDYEAYDNQLIGLINSVFVILHQIGVGPSEVFSIYDKFVSWAGAGASVPITSFGHLLIHGSLDRVKESGIMGLFMGMFDLTSSGIVAAIIFSFFLSLIFKPKS